MTAKVLLWYSWKDPQVSPELTGFRYAAAVFVATIILNAHRIGPDNRGTATW